MIRPITHIETILANGKGQRRIFDVPAMYGWVCGHLGPDRPRNLQYSSLCLSGGKQDRTIFQRGAIYTLQTASGAPILGRVKITCIHREDVREITHQDAVASGYRDKLDFLWRWAQDHDDPMADEIITCETSFEYRDHCPVFLWSRPDDFYRAWVLSFDVLKESADNGQI